MKQFATFIAALVECIANLSLTKATIQYWIEHLEELRNALKVLEKIPAVTSNTWLTAEAKAYDLLGLGEEYAKFKDEQGVGYIEGRWVLHMLKGLSCEKIVTALKSAGSKYWSYYDDLDAQLNPEEERRCPNRDGSYVRMFLASIEADPENANKSADALAAIDHEGITLIERLMLELVYFLVTGKHLDIKNATICSGSRYRVGRVPYVRFYDGEVVVYWVFPDYHFPHWRSRSADSAPVKPRVSAAEPANAS